MLNFLLIITLLALAPAKTVFAQDQNPPVYVVQSGDTLSSIAAQFGISIADLIQANSIADPNSIKPGDQLVLPGFTGAHGVLVTQTVGLGQSLTSISRQYQIPTDTILQLNQVVSPSDVFAGSTLILPQPDAKTTLNGSAILSQNEPLLALAAQSGENPWEIANNNGLAGPELAVPGDLLYYPAKATGGTPSAIPGIDKIDISPLPLVQGHTVEIKLQSSQSLTLSGSLLGRDLHFFPSGDNSFVALTGVYALQNPGPYPLDLKIQSGSSSSYALEQNLLVVSGNYPQDPHLTVDPATLDPKVTGPDDAQVATAAAPITPTKLWNGKFLVPGYDPNWITSGFGDRRYYNDDPTLHFHSGLDYGGGVGLPVKAAAAGVVVFTGFQVVRGNATIINHGWGVYTAYYHQSKINVKVGDTVTPGEVIGLYGATGRVTGPHLHFEVWVNDIQVSPYDWLGKVFP